MEPKLPASPRGYEFSSQQYVHNKEFRAPELSSEKTVERKPEQGLEKGTEKIPAESVQPVLPPPISISQPPLQDNTTLSDDAVDDTPLSASDEDLIEKEWVDKAKKIVVATKDDPYRRESEVNKLQIEYLRKRYGKELGAAE